MKKILFAVGMCANLASAANAQDDSFVAKMREINTAAPIPNQQAAEASVLSTFQAIAKKKSQCVPTSVHVEKLTPATADRMAIAGIQAGELKNAWIAYSRAIGCDDTSKTRFIVFQMPDGAVRARVLNVGDSITSPSLMRDTSANAAVAAWNAVRGGNPACDGHDLDMASSKVNSKSADLSRDFYGERYRGGWEETWVFSVCGQHVAVPVSFKADGSGGAYTHIDQGSVKVTK